MDTFCFSCLLSDCTPGSGSCPLAERRKDTRRREGRYKNMSDSAREKRLQYMRDYMKGYRKKKSNGERRDAACS